MDVAIYQSERRIVSRVEGLGEQVMWRGPVYSFTPIAEVCEPTPNGFWLQVDRSDEPARTVVVPPGSAFVESQGRRYLRVPRIPGLGPMSIDADSLSTWGKSGAYGLRLRDSRAPAPTPPPPEEPPQRPAEASAKAPPGFLF